MPTPDLAAAIFRPRAVALVGASADPAKNTARPLRYLRDHGYGGIIRPVNPKRDEIEGLTCYPEIAVAPGPIDHALLMVPRDAVAAAVEACGRAGIPVASVYADGFAEAGAEGAARQRDLLEVAARSGVRLIGPNSMGVVDVCEQMALTVNAALDTPALVNGSLAVVSQSGTALGTLLSRGQARGIGFSKLVSIGNEADIGVGELVDLLVDDNDTRTILLFMETVRGPERLAAAARRAYDAGKPVLVYKLGRSAAGRALARSHSGAMTGSGENVSAYFAAHGIIQVEVLEALLEAPALFEGQRPAAGRRVSAVTTTGGGAAMVVDRLGLHDIECAAPSEARARLAGHGIHAGSGPVLDLTMAGTRPGVYGDVLDAVLQAPDCDAVVAVVGSSGQFRPQFAVEPIVAAGRTGKPLAAFIAPEAGESLRLLADAGVAAFRTPEACADALRAYLDWRAPRAPAAPRPVAAAARGLLAAGSGEEPGTDRALRLIDALGVPVAPFAVLSGPDDEHALGYPLAAKMLGARLDHKTEAGGVILNIADRAALDAACTTLRERASAAGITLTGILVQEMVSGCAEALIAFARDPEVGPVVSLAAGGILTEIYADVAVRPAPVTAAQAREMVGEVRGLAPVRGYRGLPEGDCEALAEAVAALSALAADDMATITEAEINPVVVRPRGEGVVAVDALVSIGPGQVE